MSSLLLLLIVNNIDVEIAFSRSTCYRKRSDKDPDLTLLSSSYRQAAAHPGVNRSVSSAKFLPSKVEPTLAHRHGPPGGPRLVLVTRDCHLGLCRK
jgi:hypothetical protein